LPITVFIFGILGDLDGFFFECWIEFFGGLGLVGRREFIEIARVDIAVRSGGGIRSGVRAAGGEHDRHSA
jgi:hypothetical protein